MSENRGFKPNVARVGEENRTGRNERGEFKHLARAGGDWQARALAAESKLARLEGLERAAREYAEVAHRLPNEGERVNNLHKAARAYASENPE